MAEDYFGKLLVQYHQKTLNILRHSVDSLARMRRLKLPYTLLLENCRAFPTKKPELF